MTATRRIYLDEVALFLRRGSTLDVIAERLGVKVNSIRDAVRRAERGETCSPRDLELIRYALDERTRATREQVGIRRSDAARGRVVR